MELAGIPHFILTHLPITSSFFVLSIVIGAGFYTYGSRRMLGVLERERQELARALEYQRLLTEASSALYEYNHEVNLSHNEMCSEASRDFLEKLGLPRDSSYDASLNALERCIKEEFRQGVRKLLGREQGLTAFENGVRSLHYEFQFAETGSAPFVWMRVHARLFRWKEDGSVRMISCWQNIDAEKNYERGLLERARRDPLTGLYNKEATREIATGYLLQPPEKERRYAFFILDIDNFKHVNDTHGHAFGDQVIMVFAALIRRQFRETDVVGRIGGDEFVVLASCGDEAAWARQKAEQLVATLDRRVTIGGVACRVSTSVGIAIYPEGGRDYATLYTHADTALYGTKQRGKNGYTLYEGPADDLETC